jgi:hypothetical protein
VSYNGERLKRFTMGKGRPAPISSFGAGQGENNISESEWKWAHLQFYPLEGGSAIFSLESQSLAEFFGVIVFIESLWANGMGHSPKGGVGIYPIHNLFF